MSVLTAPITTVMDKTQPSPSGDNHDYVSYARYLWPDPSKPDGLPYIQRDGHHNLAQVARGDRARLWDFCGTVETLAKMWSADDDSAAAERAAAWLRAWLVTPATRMTPHLNYAQIALGHDNNQGHAYGIIDSRCLTQVTQGLDLLSDSPFLTNDDHSAIRAWFSAYLDWLLTSTNGRGEHSAANNHSSWFLAQVIAIASWVGRHDVARELCEEAKALIAQQITADGRQPQELSRADSLSYSHFNLEAHFQVAHLAPTLGLDLWHYTTPNGASLRKAVDYLRPYNTAPHTWPLPQHAKLAPGFLNDLLCQADQVWTDSNPKK